MFGFDEQFAMFDVTPLENQFILEYMPTARGEFVKVYLYGLMQCYHPQEGASVAQMSHELGMSEEEVLAAYRHWERKGLVRRISDNPPAYRYVGVKQHFFMGAAVQTDPEYAAFGDSLYAAFGNDRRLHGKEIQQCYEWVEDLGLPPEVVIMLVKHMISVRGKNFSISAAQKLALELAEQHVTNIDDAEEVLTRSKKVWEGSRRVLRRLGQLRDPSQDEQNLYLKWMRDWGYSPDAIEAACVETTRGKPTMAYLDGILRGMKERQGRAMTSSAQVERVLQQEADKAAPLKKLLSVMNIQGVSVNDGTLAVYDEMRQLYPDEVILLAGSECAKRGGGLDKVMELLESWQRGGLANVQQVQAYISRANDLNKQIRMLYDVWGKKSRVTAGDRKLMQRWLEEMHFTEEMILFCAEYARHADKPMLYLNSLLESYAAQGISTPEQVVAAHAAHQQKSAEPAQTGKVLRDQQYSQREYTHSEDGLDSMMAMWKEKNGDAQ